MSHSSLPRAPPRFAGSAAEPRGHRGRRLLEEVEAVADQVRPIGDAIDVRGLRDAEAGHHLDQPLQRLDRRAGRQRRLRVAVQLRELERPGQQRQRVVGDQRGGGLLGRLAHRHDLRRLAHRVAVDDRRAVLLDQQPAQRLGLAERAQEALVPVQAPHREHRCRQPAAVRGGEQRDGLDVPRLHGGEGRRSDAGLAPDALR